MTLKGIFKSVCYLSLNALPPGWNNWTLYRQYRLSNSGSLQRHVLLGGGRWRFEYPGGPKLHGYLHVHMGTGAGGY